jgi:hypothetical protein
MYRVTTVTPPCKEIVRIERRTSLLYRPSELQAALQADLATFHRNHASQGSAIDFFTGYGTFFRRHDVFSVLDHEHREIRHLAVTAQPTGG